MEDDIASDWWMDFPMSDADVTPAVLGARIAELVRSIARIEGKIDRVTDDHEQRLRRLERWMWTTTGLGAVGAASGFGALLTSISG